MRTASPPGRVRSVATTSSSCRNDWLSTPTQNSSGVESSVPMTRPTGALVAGFGGSPSMPSTVPTGSDSFGEPGTVVLDDRPPLPHRWNVGDRRAGLLHHHRTPGPQPRHGA